MKYYLFGDACEFSDECEAILRRAGLDRTLDQSEATVGVAPRLTRKISEMEWGAPALGTLIFHPSILPYHRGPDAIRWALRLGERVSGVTWFWADGGLDTGPICEQEPLLLDVSESPGRAYHTRFRPAGLRALERAVAGVVAGNPRRVPQDNALASYESFIPAPRIAAAQSAA